MQIELMCTKYINYTQCLCKPLFEFLLLGFLFGNNSSTLLFSLWKSCMINEMLDARLTDLDQEDIIVYKKINIFNLKDKSLYLTKVIDIRLFSYKNGIFVGK